MEADMKKIMNAKATKIKINDDADGWVLPEDFDGLENGNGFRKLVIYSVNSKCTWVHKGFRKNHGKNHKKKKQA